MVTVMHTRGPAGFDGPLNSVVDRRRLLALAGMAGSATAVGASCSEPSEGGELGHTGKLSLIDAGSRHLLCCGSANGNGAAAG